MKDFIVDMDVKEKAISVAKEVIERLEKSK